MTDGKKDKLRCEPERSLEPCVGRALWALEDTRRRTRSVIATVDARLLDVQPHPRANSIGSLLYHIAAIEADWLYADILAGHPFPDEIVALFPQDVRDPQDRLSLVAGESMEQHLKRLDTVRAHLRATLAPMSGEDFRRPRSLERYDVTPEWVCHHLVQHEAQHRGQIQVICDLAGSDPDAQNS